MVFAVALHIIVVVIAIVGRFAFTKVFRPNGLRGEHRDDQSGPLSDRLLESQRAEESPSPRSTGRQLIAVVLIFVGLWVVWILEQLPVLFATMNK